MKYTELEEVTEAHVPSSEQRYGLQEVSLGEVNGTAGPQEDDSLVHRKRNLRSLITAEPVIFLFQFAVGLTYPAINSLTYERVCYMTYNDSNICDNLKNETYKDYEVVVQTKASHWYITQHICFESPALLLCFFYGSLGDHFSRRVALALPCLGQLIATLVFLIVAYHSALHVAWISFGLLLLGLFGGWITLLLASYSYISEVSTAQNRTFRISIGEGMESLSMAMSLTISGIILDHTSYQFVFLLSMGLLLLAIIYCFTWLKHPPRYSTHESTCSKFKAVFQIQRVKDALTTVFKKRANRGRLRLLVLLVSLLLGMISYYGESRSLSG